MKPFVKILALLILALGASFIPANADDEEQSVFEGLVKDAESLKPRQAILYLFYDVYEDAAFEKVETNKKGEFDVKIKPSLNEFYVKVYSKSDSLDGEVLGYGPVYFDNGVLILEGINRPF